MNTMQIQLQLQQIQLQLQLIQLLLQFYNYNYTHHVMRATSPWSEIPNNTWRRLQMKIIMDLERRDTRGSDTVQLKRVPPEDLLRRWRNYDETAKRVVELEETRTVVSGADFLFGVGTAMCSSEQTKWV
jgi:hypothetical protein